MLHLTAIFIFLFFYDHSITPSTLSRPEEDMENVVVAGMDRGGGGCVHVKACNILNLHCFCLNDNSRSVQDAKK